MIKEIWKVLLPIFKWSSVAVLGAAVVISIQANADNHADAENAPVVGEITVEDLAQSDDVSEQKAISSSRGVWTPANGFADLVEDVAPAVVHVATAGIIKQRRSNRGFPRRDFRGPRGFEDFFEDFFRRQYPDRQDRDQDQEEDQGEQQTRPLGIGSGFIISKDGYVVTNHHVIDRADEIIVTLADGTEYEADITGSDPKTDLALLKLRDADDLPHLPWGDDEKSRI